MLVEVERHEALPDGGGGKVALFGGCGGEEAVEVAPLLYPVLEGAQNFEAGALHAWGTGGKGLEGVTY